METPYVWMEKIFTHLTMAAMISHQAEGIFMVCRLAVRGSELDSAEVLRSFLKEEQDEMG